MPASQLDEHEIFSVAVKISDPEAREAYLAQICENDANLLDRVMALLAAYAGDSEFLENPPAVADQTTGFKQTQNLSGTQIGRYKLLQEIGEGGFGMVYMAEQTEPVSRKVAIKVVKPGMDSREVLARFEAERQALALMDHPNIAKILDAGTTDGGHPYFVMELVKGIPLTQYCDENHLQPKERLELFVQVCDAIQHAHHKGVIHRDIKPSNVLVAEYDHQAIPKIIDFGVAKALNQKLTEKTMFTQYGQIIGTPEYMSPEQAKFNQLDVDTRSDIYSLGVLLYELMSGETPFDRERLRSAAFEELVRIIREEDPPKPSTRLKSSATLPAIANARRLSAPKLSSLLKGEMDWIIMKALDKDRARRYDTAREFAADVRRYLQDEPVHATSPSFFYQMQKLYQRHRLAVATSLLIAAVVVAGAIASSVGWMRANSLNSQYTAQIAENERLLNEKDLLLREREAAVTRADQEAKRAEENQLQAEQEAKNFLAINRFLNDGILAPFSPSSQTESITDVKMSQVLVTAARRLEEYTKTGKAFSESPQVVASLHHTLGKSFLAIGNIELAKRQLEESYRLFTQALGQDSVESHRVLLDLGRTNYFAREFSASRQNFEQAFNGLKTHLSARDPELIRARFEFAKTIEDKKAREKELTSLHEHLIRTFGPSDEKTLFCLFRLGLTIRQQGRQQEGDLLMNKSMNSLLQSESVSNFETLDAMLWMAVTANEPSKKDKLYVKTIEEMTKSLGEGHPLKILADNNYGANLITQKRYKDCVAHLERVIPIAEKSIGFEQYYVGLLYTNLGTAYFHLGETEKAFNSTRKSYLAYKGSGRRDNALSAQGSMISRLRMSQEFAKAIETKKQFVDDWKLTASKTDADSFKWVAHAIDKLFKWDDIQQAEELARTLLQNHGQPLDGAEQQMAWVYALLSKCLLKQQRFKEAESFARKSAELCRQLNPEDHWLHYVADPLLGECVARLDPDSNGLRITLDGLHGMARHNANWQSLKIGIRSLVLGCRAQNNRVLVIKEFCNNIFEQADPNGLEVVNFAINELLNVGEFETAETISKELVRFHEDNQLNDPIHMAGGYAFLAISLLNQERIVEAEKSIDEFRQVQNKCSNPSQAHWYWPTYQLARCRAQQGKYGEAEKLFLQAIESVTRASPNGADEQKARLYAGAEELYLNCEAKKHVDVNRLVNLAQKLRQEDIFLSYSLHGLVLKTLVVTENYELAEAFGKEALKYQVENKMTDFWQLRWTNGQLAQTLAKSGKFDESEQRLADVEKYSTAEYTKWNPLGYWPKFLRGTLYLERKNYKDAEPLLVEAVNSARRCADGEFFTRMIEKDSIKALIEFYERWEKADPDQGHAAQAKKWREELE